MNRKGFDGQSHLAIAVLVAGTVLPVARAEYLQTPEREAQVARAVEELRDRIRTLGDRFNTAIATEKKLEADLRNTEVSIGDVTKELRQLDQSLASKRRALGTLQDERQVHLQGLNKQQERLGRQLRAAYAIGQQDFFKMLLNQRDPATLARVLEYHRYFTRTRTQQIADTGARIARLEAVERAIEREASALRIVQAKQTQTKQHLMAQRANREALLSRLRADIHQRGQELARLEQDKTRLEQLLIEIRDALTLSDIPKSLEQEQPFAALKGQLPWPSAGRILHRTDAPRKLGALGVWIANQAGQPVYAIWHGRVAFADWLRGFGLLLIIDHGHGYMSLYGQNQSLYKEVGDWVEAGELVATVGDSGGNTEPGLYFEIRHKGVPQDPVVWCKKKQLAKARNRRL